jgi:2-C-methyl-D-erythritol 2,4-cyclodiphosphate synthase
MDFRIGQGIDTHSFVKGRDLILGGVKIPYELGLQGHSDADVLIHAIVDALLGAIGMPDIGTYFPNTDERWKNAPSSIFLKEAISIIRSEKWEISNLDCNLLLESPKILPYRQNIIDSLAALLEVPSNFISLKSGTMEGMGFVGRKEGVVALAIVLLKKIAK